MMMMTLIIGNGRITCPLDICRVRLPDRLRESRSSDCYQNILFLTAKTAYIQLHFPSIFRYFISYNLFSVFFRDKFVTHRYTLLLILGKCALFYSF